MYVRPIHVQIKNYFKSLQCFFFFFFGGGGGRVIWDFTLCSRRFLNGSGLFTLFKQFLETEMT